MKFVVFAAVLASQASAQTVSPDRFAAACLLALRQVEEASATGMDMLEIWSAIVSARGQNDPLAVSLLGAMDRNGARIQAVLTDYRRVCPS